MSGIPNNDSLQRFREVETDQHVSLREGSNDLDRKTGKLGEKIVRWITGKGETENNRTTKAFFDSLEEVYGKHVKDWAIQGYESRLDEGKPLSGYRIQQILERAQTARDSDVERLNTLLDERTPGLLQESLAKWPQLPSSEGPCQRFHQALLSMVKDEIRSSEKFKDPGKLESRSFNEEFQGIVDKFVNDHRDAIVRMQGFEDKCRMLPGLIDSGKWPPQDGFDWGGLSKEDLKKIAVPGNTTSERRQFVQNFESGQEVDDYFQSRAKGKFESELGKPEPERLSTYGNLLENNRDSSLKGHNGTYAQSISAGGSVFGHVFRMDKGRTPRHDFIDEKFHISVHPKDIGEAYKTIAPILLKYDCPLDYWKVSDVDKAKVEYEKSQLQLRDLEEKRGDYSKLTPEQFEKGRSNLQESIRDSKRLHDECQFTLYLMPEQTGDQFNDMLREIEKALSDAGVRPNELPDSDVPVGKFVSFRTSSMTYTKDDPNYDELTKQATLIDQNGNIKIRIDPFSPGYDKLKLEFGNSPYYRAQNDITLGIYRDEVAQHNERLKTMEGGVGTRDFLKLVGQTHQLGRMVAGISVPEDDKNELTGSCEEMRERVTAGLLQRLGFGDQEPPEGLTGLVELVPELGKLALEFEGREDDPSMLQRLQRGLRDFEDAKRQVLSLDGLPQETKSYLESLESELTDMLAQCHDVQESSPTVRMVSDLTHGLIQGVPVGNSTLDTIELVNGSTLDSDVKAEAEEILRLAGQLMAKSSDPGVPINIRLRMAGELESLQDRFRTLLAGQLNNVDQSGLDLIRELRTLPFQPNFDDIRAMLRQVDGSEIPDEPGNISEAFRGLGRNLENLDRGLPLLDEEMPELKDQLTYLDHFVKDYVPAPGFRAQFQELKAEVDRLRSFVR